MIDPGSTAVLDLSTIRSFSEGDKDIERQFAELFADQTRQGVLDLVQHCTDGENIRWTEVAHKMKGGAATMGAMKLRALCAQAQDMRNATADARQRCTEAVREAFEEAVDALVHEGLLPSPSQSRSSGEKNA